MKKKISCKVITPDKIVYEGEVNFAVVQVHDGERGFLYNHLPMISRLGHGLLRLYNGDSIEYIIVEGGLVEIIQNKMTVLSEAAVRKEELSREDIKDKLDKLLSQEKPRDEKERSLLDFEIYRMKTRLKVASI